MMMTTLGQVGSGSSDGSSLLFPEEELPSLEGRKEKPARCCHSPFPSHLLLPPSFCHLSLYATLCI